MTDQHHQGDNDEAKKAGRAQDRMPVLQQDHGGVQRLSSRREECPSDLRYARGSRRAWTNKSPPQEHDAGNNGPIHRARVKEARDFLGSLGMRWEQWDSEPSHTVTYVRMAKVKPKQRVMLERQIREWFERHPEKQLYFRLRNDCTIIIVRSLCTRCNKAWPLHPGGQCLFMSTKYTEVPRVSRPTRPVG